MNALPSEILKFARNAGLAAAADSLRTFVLGLGADRDVDSPDLVRAWMAEADGQLQAVLPAEVKLLVETAITLLQAADERLEVAITTQLGIESLTELPSPEEDAAELARTQAVEDAAEPDGDDHYIGTEGWLRAREQ